MNPEAPRPQPAPAAGWYPSPDNPHVKRWWDGKDWGPFEPDTRPQTSSGALPPTSSSNGPATGALTVGLLAAVFCWAPVLPWILGVIAVALGAFAMRRALLTRVGRKRAVWGMLLGVIAIGLNVVVAISVAGSDRSPTPQQQSPVAVSPTPSTIEPSEQTTPTPESRPEIVPLGSPIVTDNFTIVIVSVEMLDQIDTTRGDPLVAPDGTKLVLLHTTTTVTGNAQDLSCGSDVFTEAFDSQGDKMAPMFEANRIPGNPKCNYKTSAGETVTWSFAFKVAEDRSPAILSVIDRNTGGGSGYSDPIFAALQ